MKKRKHKQIQRRRIGKEEMGKGMNEKITKLKALI